MNALQIALILLVSIIHIYILILEMFFWTKEKGMKTFSLKTKEFAEETKTMAANQGLYNGFLAAGLIWSLIIENQDFAMFFLGCVFVAGVYGAFSTKIKSILYVQSVPAILAMMSLLFL